jgi:hypothetical protein
VRIWQRTTPTPRRGRSTYHILLFGGAQIKVSMRGASCHSACCDSRVWWVRQELLPSPLVGMVGTLGSARLLIKNIFSGVTHALSTLFGWDF